MWTYSVEVRPIEYPRVGTEDLKHLMEPYLKYLDVDVIKAIKRMFILL